MTTGQGCTKNVRHKITFVRSRLVKRTVCCRFYFFDLCANGVELVHLRCICTVTNGKANYFVLQLKNFHSALFGLAVIVARKVIFETQNFTKILLLCLRYSLYATPLIQPLHIKEICCLLYNCEFKLCWTFSCIKKDSNYMIKPPKVRFLRLTYALIMK